MAQKNTSGSNTNIRRITAADDAPVTPKKSKAPRRASSKATSTDSMGYFRGAWHELKQVRWPTRSATWGMTIAVLLFTVLFAVIILLLDAGFNWTFNQILK